MTGVHDCTCPCLVAANKTCPMLSLVIVPMLAQQSTVLKMHGFEMKGGVRTGLELLRTSDEVRRCHLTGICACRGDQARAGVGATAQSEEAGAAGGRHCTGRRPAVDSQSAHGDLFLQNQCPAGRLISAGRRCGGCHCTWAHCRAAVRLVSCPHSMKQLRASGWPLKLAYASIKPIFLGSETGPTCAEYSRCPHSK